MEKIAEPPYVDAIIRLQSVVKVPDRLKQSLSTEEGIDRDAVLAAAAVIKDRLSRIESRMQSIGTSYTLDKCAENTRGFEGDEVRIIAIVVCYARL